MTAAGGALGFLIRRRAANGFRASFGRPPRFLGLLVALALYVLWVAGAVDFLTRPIEFVGRLGEDPAFSAVNRPIALAIAELMLVWAAGATVAVFSVRSGYGRFAAADVNFVLPAPLPRVDAFRRLALARLLPIALAAAALSPVLLGFSVRPMGSTRGAAFRLLFVPALAFTVSLASLLAGLSLAVRGRRVRWPRAVIAVAAYLSSCAFVVLVGALVGIADGHSVDVGMVAMLNTAPFAWALVPFRGPAEASCALAAGVTGGTLASLGIWIAAAYAAWRSFEHEPAALYEYAARGAQTSPERSFVVKGAAAPLPFPLRAWRPAGAMALTWRTAATLWRAQRAFVYAIGVVAAAAAAFGAASLLAGGRAAEWTPVPGEAPVRVTDVALAGYGLVAFALLAGLSANLSLSKGLRFVETLKPLPWPPAVVLLAELGAGVLILTLATWTLGLTALAAWPSRAGLVTLFAAILPSFQLVLGIGDFGARLAGHRNPLLERALQAAVGVLCAGVATFVLRAAFDPAVPLLVTALLALCLNAIVSIVLFAVVIRLWTSYLPFAE
jgi:hypothetical protein